MTGHVADAKLVDELLRRQSRIRCSGLDPHSGVDPDHAARAIDQRATGIARDDRRIGLDQVDEHLAVRRGAGST